MKVYCDSTFFLRVYIWRSALSLFPLRLHCAKAQCVLGFNCFAALSEEGRKVGFTATRVCVWLQQRRKQTNPTSKTKTKHKTLKESVSEWPARAQLRERARLIPTDISRAECCVSCLCKGEAVIGVTSTLTIEPVHIEN